MWFVALFYFVNSESVIAFYYLSDYICGMQFS